LCGLDAPDWLLREIELLSKLSSVRLKFILKELLSKSVLPVVELNFSTIKKHTSTADFDNSEVKATTAALSFILRNAAKYDLDSDTLVKELQQLGLPKEHCDTMARPFAEYKERLREKLRSETLKVNSLEGVEWRVDYILSSSMTKSADVPAVQLKLKIKEKTKSDDASTEHSFELSAEKFKAFISELQTARDMMDNLKIQTEEVGLEN